MKTKTKLRFADMPKDYEALCAELLREQLCDDAQFGRHAAQARKIFTFPGACGTYLSKLEERFPERFKSRHTNKGNVWLFNPPAA